MTKARRSIFPELDSRRAKPRKTGITMMLDKCQGLGATQEVLALSGDYIDHWKLSYGTSALLDEKLLRNKIESIRARDVLVYPGGTLAEYAIVQGVCRDYMRHAVELGFNGIEISDGTIDLAPRARRDTIRFALDLGLTVVTEIGKKDPGKQPPIEVLAEQALADFDAGASWVTVEARESGRGVGVFDEDGTVVEEDVERLAALLAGRIDRIVWESPLKRQQDYFIHRFGPNVCLGNIQPRDVLALEALRAGLRFETFRTVAEQLEVTAEDTSTK